MASLRRNNSELQEKASFKKLSDNLRRLTPLEIQCHVFCGGKKCKYEGSHAWAPNQMALDGIFSHWVTCNILAMARPNTDVMETFNLIGQFQKKGIRTLINLQQPGEHAHCGKCLDHSGFSYSPDAFMKNGIFFYNFGWKDYQVGHLDAITDIVKVMAFSLKEGKIAVHCHAGLGRTGVLIACFLIYWCRITANQAIHYVRLKRPNSIQSEAQVECVRLFAQHILPNFTVFSKGGFGEFTLLEFLHRQETVLHGEDARTFKYLPKVVYQLCERLLQLSGCQLIASVVSDLDEGSGARPRPFWYQFLSLQSGSSPATTPTDKETLNMFFQDRLIAGGTGTSTGDTLHPQTCHIPKETQTQGIIQCDKGSIVQDEGSGSGVVPRNGNDEKNSDLGGIRTQDNSKSLNSEGREVGESTLTSTDVPRINSKHQNLTAISPSHSDNNNSPQTPVNTPIIVLQDDDMSVPPSAFLANRRRSVSANDLTDFMSSNVSPLLLEEPPGSPYVKVPPLSNAIEEPGDSHVTMVMELAPDLKADELFYQTLITEKVTEFKFVTGTFTSEDVAVALSVTDDDNGATIQMQQRVAELQTQVDLTPNGMDAIPESDDIHVLARLLHVWLRQLKQPVLSKQEVTRLAPCADDPVGALHKLDKGTRVTVEYILRFVGNLHPLDNEKRDILLASLVRSLTHFQPIGKEHQRTAQVPPPHTATTNSLTPSKIGHLETALNFCHKLLPLLTSLPPPR